MKARKLLAALGVGSACLVGNAYATAITIDWGGAQGDIEAGVGPGLALALALFVAVTIITLVVMVIRKVKKGA